MRAGRIVKQAELLETVIQKEEKGMKETLDPAKPTIVCLEGWVLTDERAAWKLFTPSVPAAPNWRISAFAITYQIRLHKTESW